MDILVGQRWKSKSNDDLLEIVDESEKDIFKYRYLQGSNPPNRDRFGWFFKSVFQDYYDYLEGQDKPSDEF